MDGVSSWDKRSRNLKPVSKDAQEVAAMAEAEQRCSPEPAVLERATRGAVPGLELHESQLNDQLDVCIQA